MESEIQFGKNWVKVNDSIFYLSEFEVDVLKAWYNWSVNYDSTATDEDRVRQLEYFAKAFEMIPTKNRNEAFHVLSVLDYVYENVGDAVKEIIDRIYENRKANAWVSEL